MAEIEKGSGTHPIGWSFLGAGAAVWLFPVLSIIGVDYETLLNKLDVAGQIILVVFLATLLGFMIDYVSGGVERALLHLTKIKDSNPTSKAWRSAWQTRWESSGADAEFRRYEGMASVARAYLLHSFLGGIVWVVTLWSAISVLVALVGVGFTVFFGFVWVANTKKIFMVVRAAHDWRDNEA